MTKKIILIYLILISANSVFGQAGSIYTRYGKGDVLNFNFGRHLGLGGPGISLSNDYNVSAFNPASLYNLKLTHIETGFNFNGTNISSQGNSIFYDETVFSGFIIGFPLDKEYGITASLGVIPLTNVNYALKSKISHDIYGKYDFSTSGSGGLSKVYLGTTYKLPFEWIIGATFEYYTGKITQDAEMDFSEESGLQRSKYNYNTGHHGIGTTIGLITNNLSTIFGTESITDFRFGISLNFFGKLNTNTTFTATSVVEEIEIEQISFKEKIPYRFGVGANLQLNSGYLFLMDYLFQPWTKFDAYNSDSDNLNDLHRINLSVEYKNPNARLGSFWEQVVLRGGLSFEQTLYQLENEGIEEISAHLGFSLPLSENTIIDIGFSGGIRGTTDKNLLKENIYRISLSLNFGELWFIRQDR
jgi:hypothetical protein